MYGGAQLGRNVMLASPADTTMLAVAGLMIVGGILGAVATAIAWPNAWHSSHQLKPWPVA